MEESQSYPMAVSTTKPEAKSVLPALSGLLSQPGAGHGYITNIKPDGMASAELITQALAGESFDLDSLAGQVFPCRYYLARQVEFVSEAGEAIPLPRIVLVSPDGATVAFTSDGALQSFDLIRQLCGDGPWDPPLPISAVPIRTRRNYRTFRLILGRKNEKA